MITQNFKVISVLNSPTYNWGNDCIAYLLKKKGAFTVIEELMPPNSSETKHYHQKSEQFFYCVEGELNIELENKDFILQAGEAIEVGAGIIHQVSNNSKENVRFLVISCPDSHNDRVNL